MNRRGPRIEPCGTPIQSLKWDYVTTINFLWFLYIFKSVAVKTELKFCVTVALVVNFCKIWISEELVSISSLDVD